MIALVQQKKIGLNFSKAKTKFSLSSYNGNEIYLYVNKAENCKFKVNYNICCNNFRLGSKSKDFTTNDQS